MLGTEGLTTNILLLRSIEANFYKGLLTNIQLLQGTITINRRWAPRDFVHEVAHTTHTTTTANTHTTTTTTTIEVYGINNRRNTFTCFRTLRAKLCGEFGGLPSV